jgi:hypothetical protein
MRTAISLHGAQKMMILESTLDTTTRQRRGEEKKSEFCALFYIPQIMTSLTFIEQTKKTAAKGQKRRSRYKTHTQKHFLVYFYAISRTKMREMMRRENH